MFQEPLELRLEIAGPTGPRDFLLLEAFPCLFSMRWGKLWKIEGRGSIGDRAPPSKPSPLLPQGPPFTPSCLSGRGPGGTC
ncbi:MAG: hypothetical protein DRQ04_07300 [Candidatus Hydrothermota bacterium]|nr:MAG: hypothetical protein DRQ04_07300 [Candidatus Hydrothermae bacterium]